MARGWNGFIVVDGKEYKGDWKMGLNIEVGKAYRTRSGEKVVIENTERLSVWQVGGTVINPPQAYQDSASWVWTRNGSYVSDGSPHELDLISEWQEPEPELKYKVGDIVKYQNGFKGIIVHKTDMPDGFISLPFDEDGDVESSGWYHELTGVRTGSDPQDDWSIIAPWIDPPKPLEFWANVYRDNGLLTCVGNLHLTKEAAEKVSKDAIRTSLFREVL